MVAKPLLAITAFLVGGALGCRDKSPVQPAPIPPTPDPAARCREQFEAAYALRARELALISPFEDVAKARTRAANVGCTGPFQLFDPVLAADATAGKPISQSLLGTWKQGERDLAGGGALVWVRERRLAIQRGGAQQFVPAFVDGDTLYASFTSGALPISIGDGSAFALDLADPTHRWLVSHDRACSILAPDGTSTPATCALDATKLVIESSGMSTMTWERHGEVLVHPAMERFTRQGG